MDAMTTGYNFLEANTDLRELEAKLDAHLRDLCDRNAQLSRRNAELLNSAELGWNAEVQSKKFGMIEAELSEQIAGLKFEREMFAKQIVEKENAVAKLQNAFENQEAEISGLRQKAVRFEERYKTQHDEFHRQLQIAREEEQRLAAALGTAERRFEQNLALAQESFHAQLSDLGKVAWNAGAEVQTLRDALNQSREEAAALKSAMADQDAAYRAQLTELAQAGWSSEQNIQASQAKQAVLSAQIERQRTDFENKISDLRRQLENERNISAAAKKREAVAKADAEAAFAQIENARNEARTTIQDKDGLIAAAEAKNKELSAALAGKAHIETEIERQKSAVAQINSELNGKIRELKDSSETIQKQMSVIGDQARAAQDQANEITGMRMKIENLRHQIGGQVDAVRAKEEEIESLKRDLKTKDQMIQRQLATLANLTKAEKEKEVELRRHRFTESSLTETVNELRRANSERDDLRKEFEAHIARLNQQIQDARAAGQEAKIVAERDAFALNTQLQSLRAQLESARASAEQMQLERDSARQMLNVQDTGAEAERLELAKVSAQLQQREFQLRHYASSVSDEKAEVLRRAKQLADEIRAATTLTPLKDYLALTEFELNKVESQLRKTPVISIERPRLETSFNQIAEQRDFLKAAIANSQRQLDHQAAQLLKIARPEKLTPIPPLPPRKTSV